MRTQVIRGESTEVTETPWGSLQWLVSGAAGTSQHMTFGRVTLRPGQSNPPHHHPNCDEILYVISGQIEHTLPEGGTVRLGQGDCIVLPEGKGHQATNIGNKEAVVVVAFNSPERKTVGE